MKLDITFLHLCSVNIILLLFIFAAIGYILRDGSKGSFLSTQLYKYVNIMLIIAILSGAWLLSESNFWRLALPNYKYKIFMTTILITVTVLFELSQFKKFPSRAIITITIFMIIYSISLYLGSFTNA